jgi:hypothetical protein
MVRKKTRLAASLGLLVLASALGLPAATDGSGATENKQSKRKAGSAHPALWTDPGDIKSLDLFYGCGGKEHQPKGKLRFVQEKLNGTQPKFDARDQDGVRWSVKMGPESRPEVAASRLVWAAGYFTNEDYYLPELPAKGLPPLSRGQDRIVKGKIHGVRLKRHNKGEHHIGYWTWARNPFAGTRELNGLKVLMELINNSDLKAEHLVTYEVNEVQQRYFITDLGASFGRAGANYFNHTKGVLKDFQAYPLIRKAGPEYLDFWYFKHVPRADAKWLGGILSQLSEEQIRDAFRAGGFSSKEVDGFTRKLREKINELTSL